MFTNKDGNGNTIIQVNDEEEKMLHSITEFFTRLPDIYPDLNERTSLEEHEFAKELSENLIGFGDVTEDAENIEEKDINSKYVFFNE